MQFDGIPEPSAYEHRASANFMPLPTLAAFRALMHDEMPS